MLGFNMVARYYYFPFFHFMDDLFMISKKSFRLLLLVVVVIALITKQVYRDVLYDIPLAHVNDPISAIIQAWLGGGGDELLCRVLAGEGSLNEANVFLGAGCK